MSLHCRKESNSATQSYWILDEKQGKHRISHIKNTGFMKQIETIATAANFAAIHVGKLSE